MVKRDYYEILSVERTADGETIKKAYRKLAMQYHPDRTGGDAESEAKFKEATEAFQVLSDKDKRSLYDRGGHAAVDAMGRGNGGNGGGFGVDLGDLLGDLFGGFFGNGGGGRGRRSGGPQPGRDVQVVLDVELKEAATGAKKSVTIQREDHCGTCNGTGAKPGTSSTACKRCGGQGVTVQRQGFFQVQQPCRACNGEGMIVADPCAGCRGAGRVVGRKAFDVDIPPGVDTGDRIRYQAQGDAGATGAPRGDLEFAIRVKEHKFFQRDGVNLICQWPITFAQAALGGTIQIPTLTGGNVNHELPRGTQTHEVLQLRGHGMPGRRGGRPGDLLVQVIVDTPQALTPEQEALFRQLQEMEKQQAAATPAKRSFFSKIRDFFGSDDAK